MLHGAVVEQRTSVAAFLAFRTGVAARTAASTRIAFATDAPYECPHSVSHGKGNDDIGEDGLHLLSEKLKVRS